MGSKNVKFLFIQVHLWNFFPYFGYQKRFKVFFDALVVYLESTRSLYLGYPQRVLVLPASFLGVPTVY